MTSEKKKDQHLVYMVDTKGHFGEIFSTHRGTARGTVYWGYPRNNSEVTKLLLIIDACIVCG